MYLYGHRFEIQTDHAAFTWLLNFHNLEGQVVRWLERLGSMILELSTELEQNISMLMPSPDDPACSTTVTTVHDWNAGSNLHADNHESCLLALSLPHTDSTGQCCHYLTC